MEAHTLDLVVMPGLAFNQQAHRLGQGRGYYDRFLRDCFKEFDRYELQRRWASLMSVVEALLAHAW